MAEGRSTQDPPDPRETGFRPPQGNTASGGEAEKPKKKYGLFRFMGAQITTPVSNARLFGQLAKELASGLIRSIPTKQKTDDEDLLAPPLPTERRWRFAVLRCVLWITASWQLISLNADLPTSGMVSKSIWILTAVIWGIALTRVSRPGAIEWGVIGGGVIAAALA